MVMSGARSGSLHLTAVGRVTRRGEWEPEPEKVGGTGPRPVPSEMDKGEGDEMG